MIPGLNCLDCLENKKIFHVVAIQKRKHVQDKRKIFITMYFDILLDVDLKFFKLTNAVVIGSRTLTLYMQNAGTDLY